MTKYNCIDCEVDTRTNGEYYHVRPQVWAAALGEPFTGRQDTRGEWHYRGDEYARIQNRGMLCIGCIETRLGRLLNKSDFSGASINWDDDDRPFRSFRSDRMKDRVTRIASLNALEVV